LTIRTVCVPSDCLAGVSPELSAAVQATGRAIAGASGNAVSECRLRSFINDEAADLFARIQGREVCLDELLAFRSATLRLTAPASLAGRPELVVPVHHRASGQRFGVGVLGPESGDLALLRIARLICPEGTALAV
jgi:hypothetical protein